jgi:hypothetical protein
MAAAWNKKNLTQPGFNPMTNCVWVEYDATELIHVMLHCYWPTVFKEDIKNTWFVQI